MIKIYGNINFTLSKQEMMHGSIENVKEELKKLLLLNIISH